MKRLFILSLLIISQNLHAKDSLPEPIENVVGWDFDAKHTIIQKQTNMQQIIRSNMKLERTKDIPTHIIRIQGEVGAAKKKCEEIGEEMNNIFSSKIAAQNFYYTIISYCGYDPNTDLAVRYSLHSYFDPLDDEAVEYAKNYISGINGKDFFGMPFLIEAAEGLAVSMNIDSGLTEPNKTHILLRQNHDNESLYFTSHYEMIKSFITDVYARFYSNEENVVIPFFQKWLYPYGGGLYRLVLRRSNYVLLQPEKLFLMKKEPKVYTCPLRLYYAHNCFTNPNGRCL